MQPMHLSNYAKQMRKDDTNFLTFNKTKPAYMAVEFAKAETGERDWAVELDDTFAKNGVWDFRYTNIANPYAAGDVYNRDMGGPNIFKTVPDNTRSEAMGATGKKVMGMHVVKKESASVAKYVKNASRSSQIKSNVPPAGYYNNAYDKYGYKEMGIKGRKRGKVDEDQGGGEMGMFMRNKAISNKTQSKERETAVYKRDANFCPAGNTWVDGVCLPTEPRANPICPYGWVLNEGGRCQLAPSKEFMSAKATGDMVSADDTLKLLESGKMVDSKRESHHTPPGDSNTAHDGNAKAKHATRNNNMTGSKAASAPGGKNVLSSAMLKRKIQSR